MIIPLFSGLAAALAVMMILDPNLPGRRPGRGALVFSGIAVGLLTATLLSIVGDANIARLAAVALAIAVIGGATATDVLRDRIVNGYVVLGTTIIVAILSTISHLTNSPLFGILGVILTGGAGLVLFGGGILFARLRHAPDDELTGEQIEDFGWGDVIIFALVGAALGPVFGLIAFIAGIFVNGLMAIPIFIVDRLRGRDMMTRHVPMLPGIMIGTILVMLLYASRIARV